METSATLTAMNRQASTAPTVNTGASVRRAGGVARNQRPTSSPRPTTVTPARMTSCRPLRIVEVAGLRKIWAALVVHRRSVCPAAPVQPAGKTGRNARVRRPDKPMMAP